MYNAVALYVQPLMRQFCRRYSRSGKVVEAFRRWPVEARNGESVSVGARGRLLWRFLYGPVEEAGDFEGEVKVSVGNGHGVDVCASRCLRRRDVC